MREVWLLSGSDQIVKVHTREECRRHCVVHNPTEHLLRGTTLGYDTRTHSFFRTCAHKVQHLDPDEKTFWARKLEFAKKGDPLWQMAQNKLNSWGCPDCSCGCCDLTRIA